jgi:phage N-6-adenine-methyltransferase
MAANIQHSSNSQEWYTPIKYIQLVNKVMGKIQLDPASSIEANKRVKAVTYYDKSEDGLGADWFGRVFLNPPYGPGGVTDQWISKLLAQYEKGNVTEFILLVNNATGTRWFQKLWPFTICFVQGRIRFDQPTGVVKGKGPSHAQVFVYGGPQHYRFYEVFKDIGHIVWPTITASEFSK